MHPSADERIAAIQTYVPTVKVPAMRAFPVLQTNSIGLRDHLTVPTWVSSNAILVPLVAFAIYCGFTTRWTSVDRNEVLAQKQEIQIAYEFALTGIPESYRSMVIASAKQMNETYDLNLDMERLKSIKSMPQEAMTITSGKMPPPTVPNPSHQVEVGKVFDAMMKMEADTFNYDYGGGVVQFSSDGTVKQLDNITRPEKFQSGNGSGIFGDVQPSVFPPGVLKRMKDEGVSPDVIALYEQQFKAMSMARSNSSSNQNGSENALAVSAAPAVTTEMAESPQLSPELQAFERLSNASWNQGTSGLSTVAIPALILFVLWRILAGIGGVLGWLRRFAFDR
jgi:hypothetical protein